MFPHLPDPRSRKSAGEVVGLERSMVPDQVPPRI